MTEPRLLARAVRALLLATPAVVLIAPAGFMFPFVSVRAVIFRAAVLLAAAATLLLLVRQRADFAARRDPIFLALLAWLVVAAVSALFGAAPWQSIYGDLERMGGVVALGHLVVFYVLLRSHFDERVWRSFARVSVGVGLLMSAHAILEFTVRGRVESLIGNSGIFGGYLLFQLAFAAWAALRTSGRERHAFALALLPLATALVLSRNRSSLLGLLIGAWAALLLLSLRDLRWRKWAFAVALAPLLFLTIPVVARLVPDLQLQDRLPGVLGKLARPGSEDAARLHAWKAGFEAFKRRPALGYGPENYRLVWAERTDTVGVGRAVATEFDRAHNAYVDALALTGAAGLIAWASIWVAAFLLILRALHRGSIPAPEAALLVGIYVAYAVYLFFWFDDVNGGIFFVALLALTASRTVREPLLRVHDDRHEQKRLLPIFAMLAILASLYLHSFEALRVARWLGQAETRPLSVETKLAAYSHAFASPAPQTLHTATSFIRFLDALSPSFPQIRADQYRAPIIAAAFEEGFRFVDLLQARDPRDPQHYQSEGSLAQLALRFYLTRDYYDRALASFDTAMQKSPLRLGPRYLLAETHTMIGAFDSAQAVLERTRALTGEIGETYYYLAKVDRARGDTTAAVHDLIRSIELGYVPMPPIIDFVAGLEAAGRYEDAASLTARTLEAKLGPWQQWTPPNPPPDTLTGVSRDLASRLPLLLLRAGRATDADAAAEALGRRQPGAAAVATRFRTSLRSGDTSAWLALPPGAGLLPAQPSAAPGSPR